jgi:hypothetical protein
MSRAPIPLRPDYGAARTSQQSAFLRAVTCDLIAFHHKADPREIASRAYPGESLVPKLIDRNWNYVQRADKVPASVTGSTWSEQLASTNIADFLISVGAPTAGAALLQRGIQVNLRGTSVKIPYIAADKASANFVQELSPLPVYNYSFADGVTLGLKKFGTIIPFTREVFEFTAVPGIEAIVRDQIARAVALQLDSMLFDATASDAIRPAGLLNGAGGAIASTAASAGVEAVREDVAKLHAAVAPLANGQRTVLVASPGQYARIMDADIRSCDVFESSALAVKTVLAFAPPCVVSAGGEPIYSIATETALHMANPAAELVPPARR